MISNSRAQDGRTYELHPLCSLFPRLAGAEFEALKADIKANGLNTPIVLAGGMILDGGNRYHACLEVGVTPSFVNFTGTNLVSHVLSANLHRRHMTPGQHAAIVASAQDWAKAQTVGKPKSVNIDQLHTVEQRAAQSGASRSTQKMADKVAKEAPDLALQVAHGEVSLAKAAEQITPKKAAKPENQKPTAAEREQSQVEKLKTRVAELEKQVESLESRLINAEEAAEQAVETAANLQAIADGDEAKRLELLSSKLRASETRKNGLMNQNADLLRQLKAYQRRDEKRAA